MTSLKQHLRHRRDAYRHRRAIEAALRNAPTASMRRELLEIANDERYVNHLR